MPPSRCTAARGHSLIELIFVLGLGATVTAAAVPQLLAGVDDFRAVGATRYMSARLQRARMTAIMRSTDVALQFTQSATGYAFTEYIDGNRNGLRTAEVTSGIDRALAPPERLPDQFAGVDFGAIPGLPPVDPGGVPPGSDPIRLGASSFATFTPRGTSSTGSLYIRSRGNAQYVIRVFGNTGKTRILHFNARTGRWEPL